jgi:glycosyltransferase involved in cell wall biosynthesis
VRKLLFVIPDLEPGGAARQLVLLAAGLPPDQFARKVCVLGPNTPWADSLRGAGVEVEALGWRLLLDPQPFLALRRVMRAFQPDVLHAWRLPALRAVAAVGGVGRSRLVVSAPFCLRDAGTHPGWADRWLLRRAARVVAGGPFEARVCRRLGLPADRVAEVPPGVVTEGSPAAVGRAEFCRSLGLPEAARLLMAAGPLERAKGLRDAVWSFDVLRYVYDDVHLVLLGRGPDRPRLEGFVDLLKARHRVHFVDAADVPALLTHAEVVWAPDRAGGSVNAVLEAMAAGRPVVASRLPALAEVVADGETGYQIPPGDKAALARRTRRLLDDAGRRRQMGAAGRKRVEEHFGAAAMVRRFAGLYAEG